ncbi:MAG: hypothetical protein PHV32_11160 [Eubacteriales bacterium]|nr:hypothetical protein [Eubacteriales bacterium]
MEEIQKGSDEIDTLFFAVISRGKANAILHKARECGASGGTIFLGEGTVQSKLLENMGLTETHSCIITIVDKGRSKDCIKSARAAGARGGTLIHGRGAGIPTDFYFPLVIEPQKDIVMVITTNDKASTIGERIFSDLELGKTGNGIIFTLPVIRVSGLFENRSEESRGVKP